MVSYNVSQPLKEILNQFTTNSFPYIHKNWCLLSHLLIYFDSLQGRHYESRPDCSHRFTNYLCCVHDKSMECILIHATDVKSRQHFQDKNIARIMVKNKTKFFLLHSLFIIKQWYIGWHCYNFTLVLLNKSQLVSSLILTRCKLATPKHVLWQTMKTQMKCRTLFVIKDINDLRNKKYIFLAIITCNFIYTMDYSKYIVSNQKEESISW